MNKNINKQETIKILFLGESTTVGQGADTIRDNYVSKTTNHFKNLGFNIEYISISKGGMTSTWGITKIQEVINYKADIIIIEFFINDQYLSAETIKNNYSIFSAIPYGEIIIFNIYDNVLFNNANQNITNINLNLQDSSRWYKKIDTYSKLPKNWGTYLVDGVHPNNYGYSILSQILIDEMTGLILKIQLQKNIVK